MQKGALITAEDLSTALSEQRAGQCWRGFCKCRIHSHWWHQRPEQTKLIYISVSALINTTNAYQ